MAIIRDSAKTGRSNRIVQTIYKTFEIPEYFLLNTSIIVFFKKQTLIIRDSSGSKGVYIPDKPIVFLSYRTNAQLHCVNHARN